MEKIRLIGLPDGSPQDHESYRRAKTPFGRWQQAAISDQQARAWLARGGWIGWKIPTGIIAVDIDDIDTADRLPTEGFYCIQTPRGRQYLFRDTGAVDSQRAGILTRAGLVVDYRLAGRGYIVAPCDGMRQWSGGRERKILSRVPSEQLPPLPDWCLPVGVARPETEHLFPLKQGQRNDGLFRHASRLRASGLSADEITSALSFCNQHLVTPPLPVRELQTTILSASKYEPTPEVRVELIPLTRVDPPNVISAQALLHLDLPPVQWLVDSVLPPGLAMLVGRAKTGKSWWILQLALSVASGQRLCDKWRTDGRGVLYLALEDNLRRLQRRLTERLARETEPPANLEFATEWKNLRAGGAEQINDYLAQHSDCGCVIIDTLQKVRGVESGKINAYQADYEILGLLKQIADAHNVALLVVHHTRKGEADDWFDLVSGTTGLSGAVDSLLYLDRKRGESEARLHATGRDFEVEIDELLFWSRGEWRAQGASDAILSSRVKTEIVECLQKRGALRTIEIANELNKPATSLSRPLAELESSGVIERFERGRYRVALAENEVLL